MAVREVIRFISNYAVRDSIIESGAKEIIDAINKDQHTLKWGYTTIVEEIQVRKSFLGGFICLCCAFLVRFYFIICRCVVQIK